MARPLRIEFAGAIYHVMSRGNARQAIVRDDADREKRLDWLRRTVETYGWRLHAFVLMRNHELCEASHNSCYVNLPIM
jgi:REP element-mobilizing transposase RayT